MQKIFNRSRIMLAAGLLAVTVVVALGYCVNLFRVAPADEFQVYLHESEALVLSKVIADREHIGIPNHANLGFATAGEYVYDSDHVAEAYGLLPRRAPPARDVHLTDLTDANWDRGVARASAAILLSPSEGDLIRYVGRVAILPDGTSRAIRLIHVDSAYIDVYLDGPPISPSTFSSARTVELTGTKAPGADIRVFPYTSQVGFQGILDSSLANGLHLDITGLYRIQSLLLAATLLGLALLYRKILGTEFAVIFFLTVAFSPWLTLLGRNLYWITYLWFLPAAFIAAHYLSTSARQRAVLMGAYFLAVLSKSLSGYEYLSTVIWFAGAVYLVAPFLPERRYNLRQAAGQFALVCGLGVLAFVTALLIHAQMRGHTILEGLRSIYVDDVQRRTYGGDGARFGAAIAESLSASPFTVLRTYIFGWTSNLLPGVKGNPAFPVLLAAAICTAAYKAARRWPTAQRDVAILAAFLPAPISWFVLAKGHSYIHTHINYVLWYFGAVAAIIYVAFNGLRIVALSISRWRLAAQPEQY